MHPFITTYTKNAVPRLKEFKTYASQYQIPKVSKVVVNIGVGDTIGNSKALEDVILLSTQITGQRPVQAKARKAIAGFKIREGNVIGLKTTLRDERMNDFLAKLLQVVLPRTRDFRGLPPTGITADGNLNIGIRDSMIFPEVAQGGQGHGIQVTIVSNATSMEEARLLFESIGFVFQKEDEIRERTVRKSKNYGKRK